jgi:GTP-binding protein HflX
LILDIFAQRARSFEGKLQVELAQLKHLSTRLVRGWTHLERQKGGIGLRGPGETQLETDRRLLATRVRSLTRKLARLRQQRDTGRNARAGIPVPGVALVGYTNAGKSTLFRALTGADAYIADLLFATLDPTVRKLTLPGGARIVVADTVGFIRELPHELVAAFQSTLQEARSAQLLVHLIDAADARRDEYTGQVNAVLAEIGAGSLPQLLVYNKIDRLDLEPRIERDAAGAVRQVWISAAQSRGIELLKEAIAERLELRAQRGWLRLPAGAGALRARLFAGGAVREERTEDDGAMRLLIELPPEAMAAIARNPGVKLTLLPAELPCAHA